MISLSGAQSTHESEQYEKKFSRTGKLAYLAQLGHYFRRCQTILGKQVVVLSYFQYACMDQVGPVNRGWSVVLNFDHMERADPVSRDTF